MKKLIITHNRQKYIISTRYVNIVCYLLFITISIIANPSIAQVGCVVDFINISDNSANLIGLLDNPDAFNRISDIGDLNKDNIPDIAVGAFWDDDGFDDAGAVWILFLNPDLTVKDHQKISATEGGLNSTLIFTDAFGYSICKR